MLQSNKRIKKVDKYVMVKAHKNWYVKHHKIKLFFLIKVIFLTNVKKKDY